MLRLMLAIALCLAGIFAHAQSPGDTQPGMWEYQMEMKMPGMPMAIPPTVMRRCLTPQDVAQNKHLTNERDAKNPCTLTNMKASSGRIAYEFSCKTDQGVMKGTASGSVSPTSLDLETRMQMVPPVQGMSEMQQHMRARRIGNC